MMMFCGRRQPNYGARPIILISGQRISTVRAVNQILFLGIVGSVRLEPVVQRSHMIIAVNARHFAVNLTLSSTAFPGSKNVWKRCGGKNPGGDRLEA